MKKVFFGGSRKMGKLNKAIRVRTDNVIKNNLLVLLGDANGADKAFQKYLAEHNYKNVLIFYAGLECRNNVGGWQTRQIASDRQKKDFQFYVAKDTAMSDEADYGFMLWDGISKGTLNNILNLIERKKQVVVYYSPEKKFLTLQEFEDLKSLLTKCSPETIRGFDNNIKLSKRVLATQEQLNLV